MTDSYIQWSKLLDFFSQICPFWERERDEMCVLIIWICLSVPTNNETVNLVLLQKHVVAEKYNVAIQYGSNFITIKVACWQVSVCE